MLFLMFLIDEYIYVIYSIFNVTVIHFFIIMHFFSKHAIYLMLLCLDGLSSSLCLTALTEKESERILLEISAGKNSALLP